MSQGSFPQRPAAGVAARLLQRDRSSGRKRGPVAGAAQVSTGNARANRGLPPCDCSQHTEIGEVAPSLRRTASPPGTAANPSRGISRCRTGSPDEAAHGDRLDWQQPLSGRSSKAASPRVRSNPGLRCREDLPAGRSPSGPHSGTGRQRLSRPIVAPTASEFL
jgi:hypothetical protein